MTPRSLEECLSLPYEVRIRRRADGISAAIPELGILVREEDAGRAWQEAERQRGALLRSFWEEGFGDALPAPAPAPTPAPGLTRTEEMKRFLMKFACLLLFAAAGAGLLFAAAVAGAGKLKASVEKMERRWKSAASSQEQTDRWRQRARAAALALRPIAEELRILWAEPEKKKDEPKSEPRQPGS